MSLGQLESASWMTNLQKDTLNNSDGHASHLGIVVAIKLECLVMEL